MLTLYGIANCDKIRKTRRWLEERQIDYVFHDYRKDGCPAELMSRLLEGLGHEALLNTRGSTWRALPEASKRELDSEGAGRLMREHPALIRRPLIHANRQWLLGYDTERLQALVSQNKLTE